MYGSIFCSYFYRDYPGNRFYYSKIVIHLRYNLKFCQSVQNILSNIIYISIIFFQLVINNVLLYFSDLVCVYFLQETGVTPLMIVVRENKLVLAERLLDLGAGVNDKSKV